MTGRKSRPNVDAIRTSADDRRKSPRYQVKDDEVWLGYKLGEEFKTCQALLLDVSVRGAMIAADIVPKSDKVWICLRGPSETEWIESTVVGVKRTWRGPHKLRLSFDKNCPYSFFKAAVYGVETFGILSPPAGDTQEDAPDREWW